MKELDDAIKDLGMSQTGIFPARLGSLKTALAALQTIEWVSLSETRLATSLIMDKFSEFLEGTE